MVNLHEAPIVLRGTMTLAYLAYDASQTNRNCTEYSSMSTLGDPVGPVEECMGEPASTPCSVWGAAESGWDS